MKKLLNKVYSILKRDPGFTVIENIVALVLITAVLVPSGLYFVKLANSKKVANHSSAILICRTELEYTIAHENFYSDEWRIHYSNKDWMIRREIRNEYKLVNITIYCKPVDYDNWVYSLSTSRCIY